MARLAVASVASASLLALTLAQCNHPLVSWDYNEDPVGTWFGVDSHWDPSTPQGYNEVEIGGNAVVSLAQDLSVGPAKLHTIRIGANAQWQISPQSQGQVLAGSSQEQCAPLCPSLPGWVAQEATNRIALPPLLVFEGSTDPVYTSPLSGFGDADTLSIFVDVPKKYTNVSVTFGLASDAEQSSIWGDSPDQLLGCYDRWNLTAPFANVEPLLIRGADAGGSIRYVGKIRYHAEEAIWTRVPYNRTISAEVPFELIFPQQVTSVFSGITAFDIPNTGAALVFQEIDVQIQNPPVVDFAIRIATTIQHPFRFSSTATHNYPTALFDSLVFGISTDCPDPGLPDFPNPAVDNSLQCVQVWTFSGSVASGICEADGDYDFTVDYECQPSFVAQTDCPFVQDDKNETVTQNTLRFKVDTEFFCPTVVDQISVASELDAWRNIVHDSQAANFQAGQTIYFRVFTTAPQVSITGLTITDIFLTVTATNATHSETTNHNVWLAGVDQNVVNNLAVHNAGDTFTLFAGGPNEATHTVPLGKASAASSSRCAGPSGSGDPCAEGWFEWTLDEPVFDPPEDGSRSFNVIAKLSVDWASVPSSPLLEKRSVLYKQVLLDAGRFKSRAAVVDLSVEAADFVETTSSSSEEAESSTCRSLPASVGALFALQALAQ